jgi:hypothetical protein
MLAERLQQLDGASNYSTATKFVKSESEAGLQRQIAMRTSRGSRSWLLLSRNGVVAITAAISRIEQRETPRARRFAALSRYMSIVPWMSANSATSRTLRQGPLGRDRSVHRHLDPYEPPEQPEVTVHTDRESVEESVDHIPSELRNLGYLLYEAAGEGSAYTPEEEALVEERLKNLGYLCSRKEGRPFQYVACQGGRSLFSCPTAILRCERERIICCRIRCHRLRRGIRGGADHRAGCGLARGWRDALEGTVAAAVVLAVIVALVGLVCCATYALEVLRTVIGALLLVFD